MRSKHDRHTTGIRRKQRGAALILTVIVIMVLTTLGMAMVAFTTTEERTATTYRDSLQTRAVAEAGVRIVQEMFRNPTDRKLVPLYNSATTPSGTVPTAYDYYGATETAINTSLNELGIWRSDRTGAIPSKYSGNNNRFFYPPFKDTWSQTFGGTYSPASGSDVYDLRFNCNAGGTGSTLIANASTKCWLETNINSLLVTSTDWSLNTAKIVDISFYAPPQAAGKSYGITTVRVTAEKYDLNETPVLLGRETVEALIGDNNLTPAMMGDGRIATGNNINGCGDGCEQVHANGSIVSGGDWEDGDPVLSATGSVPSGTGGGAGAVVAPEINPWDLAYKPTTSANLSQYYLAAARQLDAVWTDGGAASLNPAPRECGFSTCQDYNLEFNAAGTAKGVRSATGDAYLYKYRTDGTEDWTLIDSAVNGVDDTLTNTSIGGDLSITVTRGVDTEDLSWTDDNADIPFNSKRVPTFTFVHGDDEDGVTLLVDGDYSKSSNADFVMTIIAAGSISFHGHTDIKPAMDNKVMLIAGRDFKTHSSFNNNIHNMCNHGGPPTTTQQQRAGIIAVHGQIDASSQSSLMGLVIAENRTDHDSLVTRGASNTAINIDNGDHSFMCDSIDWPWTRATKPIIFSLTTAAN